MSQNITSFGVFPIKKSESVHGAFLSHLDVKNVTVDCWFTQVERYSCFFVHVYVPLQSGPLGPGMYTCAHRLVGVLLYLPQCWLDEWVTILVPVTNCSVLLASAVQQVTVLSAHMACVLWNSSYASKGGAPRHTVVVVCVCVYVSCTYFSATAKN